jgi:hypothetical protein
MDRQLRHHHGDPLGLLMTTTRLTRGMLGARRWNKEDIGLPTPLRPQGMAIRPP